MCADTSRNAEILKTPIAAYHSNKSVWWLFPQVWPLFLVLIVTRQQGELDELHEDELLTANSVLLTDKSFFEEINHLPKCTGW